MMNDGWKGGEPGAISLARFIRGSAVDASG